jgi:hypothetical protein
MRTCLLSLKDATWTAINHDGSITTNYNEINRDILNCSKIIHTDS